MPAIAGKAARVLPATSCQPRPESASATRQLRINAARRTVIVLMPGCEASFQTRTRAAVRCGVCRLPRLGGSPPMAEPAPHGCWGKAWPPAWLARWTVVVVSPACDEDLMPRQSVLQQEERQGVR
jgi:hypothetical protein